MVNVKEHKLGQNTRMSFSKSQFPCELPNLVEVQTKSFKWFLEEGLMEVLRDVSPITDHSEKLVIEFVSYSIDSKPKYTVEECKERDANYAAPLKVNVRLTNKETGEVKQTDIFMGDFPIMTETGTFVINGAERVIVSQIIRSPGMYYDKSIDKAGNELYAAQVIPNRGAWFEYEVDSAGVMYVRIDKNRKVPLTMFIRALGMETRDEIYEMFGNEALLTATFEKDESEALAAHNGSTCVNESLKEIYKKLRPGEPAIVESAQILINNYFFDNKRYDIANVGRYKFDKKMAIHTRLRGHVAAADIVSPLTGEVIVAEGQLMDNAMAHMVEDNAVNEAFIRLDNGDVIKVFSNHTVRPECVLGYDLKDCGINEKVSTPVILEILEACGDDVDALKAQVRARMAELCPKFVTKSDIFATINYLLNLTHGVGTTDDIDHLGNRRIRSVGEQLQQHLRSGFLRMDKIIKERMISQDNEKLTPSALINIKPVTSAVREFFGSSQLSQFMDQNNPLAELTHKRRLSALGPGGLSRERASFDVRDVHYTHYGRMCPIETPEGPNIGLISYLTTYARINDYGFIEAPFRRIDKETGTVTDEVVYMTADREDNFVVVPANEPLDENNKFVNARVTARDKGEFVERSAFEVDFMDVSPKMVVSVATAM
ncbi:MAG: DNA-directed RNA polymerase subunit beta, partial [Clostridia bacterium]|nr:DNA-directed RNA polymerase subunit beta [Clostridia bacterium]